MLRKRRNEESESGIEERSPRRVETKKCSSHIFRKLLVSLIVIVYIVFPLAVYFCPAVCQHGVFMHYLDLSWKRNLSRPEEHGLDCARNFYIDSGSDIKLGVWHVAPASVRKSRCRNGVVPAGSDSEIAGGELVFLYLHGSAGSRAERHRVSMYKLLSEELDAHVIGFDYRGFGDSTNVLPTEAGMVEDTQHVYDWLLKQGVDPSRIFLWGHSLGTGIGIAFAHRLSSSVPGALILEAPFTTIAEVVKEHPLALIYKYFPFAEDIIDATVGGKDTLFDSLGRISQVQCPVLILHAEDDGYAPFHQGQELYEVALKRKKADSSPETKFVGFGKDLNLGHMNIHQHPELPNIIRQFIGKIRQVEK